MAVGGGVTEETLVALMDNALAGVVATSCLRKIAAEVFQWAKVNLCSDEEKLRLTEQLLDSSHKMTRDLVELKGRLGG